MRYLAEQKAEIHEKILAAAARSFREHGSENNGIGQVMKELGLTKGGFYGHFESKRDLYAAAVARAFQELGDRMASFVQSASSRCASGDLRANCASNFPSVRQVAGVPLLWARIMRLVFGQSGAERLGAVEFGREARFGELSALPFVVIAP